MASEWHWKVPPSSVSGARLGADPYPRYPRPSSAPAQARLGPTGAWARAKRRLSATTPRGAPTKRAPIILPRGPPSASLRQPKNLRPLPGISPVTNKNFSLTVHGPISPAEGPINGLVGNRSEIPGGQIHRNFRRESLSSSEGRLAAPQAVKRFCSFLRADRIAQTAYACDRRRGASPSRRAGHARGCQLSQRGWA